VSKSEGVAPLPAVTAAAEVAAGSGDNSWAKLPVVEQAERWEQLVPGTAERMIREVELGFAHERKMAWTQMVLQTLGAVLGSGTVLGYIWLAKYYLDHGEATAGAGILGTGAVAAAGVFVGWKARNRG
jgi:hypothetical protein